MPLELKCKPGVIAMSYLTLLYGMAFFVVIFSDYYWQMKTVFFLLLISAGMHESWRLFFYRQRPSGIRFAANQWSLMIDQRWCQQDDLVLYYDWFYCLALRYRDRENKNRFYFIWRETLPLNDWRKLRSHVYIYLN